MELTKENAEEMLKAAVRMSTGCGKKLSIADKELRKQFIKDIFERFPLEVVYILARTTEVDESKHSMEIGLDFMEFYSYLKKSKSVKIISMDRIEKVDIIPKGKFLCILYESIEPGDYSKNIFDWMNDDYCLNFEKVNWSLKKSDKDGQTLIIFTG